MSKQPPLSPILLSSPTNLRSRRDSINSISVSSQVDKEQLAHALDQIHTSASQSAALTTFNDFSAPPGTAPVVESKGTTGDLVQQGLSGLYSRIKEAVGVAGKAPAADADDGDSQDAASKRSSSTANASMKSPVSSLARGESGATHMTFNSTTSSDVPMTATTSSGVITTFSDSQMLQSSKASSITTMTASKSTAAGSQNIQKIIKAAAVDPAIASVSVGAFKDHARGTTAQVDDLAPRGTGRRSISRPSDGQLPLTVSASSSLYDVVDSKNGVAADRAKRSRRDDSISVDGSSDTALSPVKISISSSAQLLPSELSASGSASRLSARDAMRKPAVIDRISRAANSGDRISRSSSMERGTAEPSPISTSAHNSVYHDSFAHDERPQELRSGNMRIPGTTTNEGAPGIVNARLELMRRQVLSKEFWMADETCKECFLCGESFTAWRRKHHCRTCGCIFDSKCTSTISGQRFGVTGNLRVCKTCLNIINRRYDSGSEESGDDSYLPAIFRPNTSKPAIAAVKTRADDEMSIAEKAEDLDNDRSATTPMMAIPATRRIGDASNRHSAVLEIDAPQLSRPGSSRSLKSLASGRPQSAGHKRHHSKHNFLGRFRPTAASASAEEVAPFRNAVSDEVGSKSKLPAFHDDNIIDPELAPYMSEESSEDEQMSIFATMAKSDLTPSSLDPDKSNFGPFLSAVRKHRLRPGEKSVSGLSFTSRGGFDEGNGPPSTASHSRPIRRRNMSTASANQHHMRSPRPKSGVFKGLSLSNEALGLFDNSAAIETTKLTRSNSVKDEKTPNVRLNLSSLKHLKNLYHQLLQDAEIPNAAAWERALVPVLVRCADDVDPETRNGDHMDVRHYLKLKKIPGGKPSDTSYVSGVIFTKNLALKSMPRSIVDPRIVLVSFPIEYQRQPQQHFMSLQPVIEQEKEYLRMVVNRIINLRPQVLLAARSVSGVALQYLSEAGIAVAYNVKPSVIEAVSRCARTDIISSLDMLALPVMVGQCGGFEVKTFVSSEIPGRKKTCIFISDCEKSLGCTIALRGASTMILTRMKRITEFMVYVAYNLKLESCLLRDEYLGIPGDFETTSIPSTSRQASDEGLGPVGVSNDSPTKPVAAAATPTIPTVSTCEGGTQPVDDSSAGIPTHGDSSEIQHHSPPEVTKKLISLHESHSKASQDGQVPEDVPAPTYYSDMVAKYETKILSASPFVKFTQPYLLMKAREQERRLVYLKRLRDQDIIEVQGDSEKAEPQRFQLIKPEMVHAIGQKGPRQIMEVLHAVHDAEYDKALHQYQKQTRQWEAYIQGNLDLFDPCLHQNIVVLYSVVCTETKIPCAEPGLIAIGFYDEHPDPAGNMDPDCTLGQYVEDLCESANELCLSNGCDRPMWQHHRTYVHDEARVTVFIERDARVPPELIPLKEAREDDIFMWSYCRLCKRELGMMAMSDSTWKYSFGKYLELSFWSKDLHLHGDFCTHDHHEDHIRYFHFSGANIRVHYDPIDLLEIVVPRPRITWKVDNDLRLKNEIFTRTQDRWNRYMNSVRGRIKGIRIDSVLPEKTETCKTEVERLAKQAQEDQLALVRALQEAYMSSKYYENLPMNGMFRKMAHLMETWDTAFSKFETDFLSDKDVRQLTMMQLKKMMFTDNESKESLSTADGTSIISLGSDSDDKTTPPTTQFSTNDTDDTAITQPTDPEPSLVGVPSIESNLGGHYKKDGDQEHASGGTLERVDSLDLATSAPQERKLTSAQVEAPPEFNGAADQPQDTGPPVSPTRQTPNQASLVQQPSLSEKVEQLRREQGGPTEISNASTAPSSTDALPEAQPRVAVDRGSSRRAGLTVSPPMVRALSQPVGAIPRPQAGIGKPVQTKEPKSPEEHQKTSADGSGAKTDKKFTISLGALKSSRKAPQSSIPRYVHKKKESKVSTLARHFEQLTREFEKERMRDRKQRAAKLPYSRAFLPRSSTRAIVEVYQDVDQAVHEPAPAYESNHSLGREQGDQQSAGLPSVSDFETQAPSPVNLTEKGSLPPTEPPSQADETSAEAEADEQKHAESTVGSDDEGGSDEDQALEDILPDVETIAEHLEPNADIPQELQRDKKSTLMKMLTTFWAERSASSWSALEYPLNLGDHIFDGSNIMVREDEPTSLVALALESPDYNTTLEDIRHECSLELTDELALKEAEGKGGLDESILLTRTARHLKFQFSQGSATMLCKIFWAEHFDAVRRQCGVADRFVESLSRCLKWDSKGGKTKSVFLKTLDDRFVIKSLSPVETTAFLKFAYEYFGIMKKVFFEDLPSVIAKMLGFFQVIIKNPVTGADIKLDLLVMENLFYDRSDTRKFDLKGSMRNRKIQSTGEQNEVLLDENMVEFIYESPLFAREHSKKVLRASVWNDTLFLAKVNVMDYSLMVAVDEPRKELVVGIIDCIRTYTWDKKLESWIKDRGFAGGGRNRPTVTSPKEYKSRFREAMARYILQAPNCWHQFGVPHSIASATPRTRFEEADGEE